MLKIAAISLFLIFANNIHSGQSLQCYSCSAAVNNNESSNKGCADGDKSSMHTEQCPTNEPQVCMKYSYSVSGSSIPSVSRSCSPNRNPCENIEAAINIVPNILPGTRTCVTCNGDLCNSSITYYPSVLLFCLLLIASKLY